MNNWYKQSWKRINSDLHIEDYDNAFLSKHDAETYLEEVKSTGAQSLWIWLQSHIGYCYFPTKVGYTHKRYRDKNVGEFLDLCEQKGLNAVAYYSLVYNNQIGRASCRERV